MPVGAVVRRHEPGFFLGFPSDAAGNVDRAIPDVVGVRRSRRKVNAPGIRRVRAHLAQHEGAVAGAKRAHAKSVEHVLVGKPPIAPRQEAGKISFEIFGAEAFAGKTGTARQQHAAIPDLRFLALLAGEMRVNVGTASFGERPPKGADLQVKPRDPLDGWLRHCDHANLTSRPSPWSWPDRRTRWCRSC